MLLMSFAFTALLDLEMTYAISEYILQTLICENFNHYFSSKDEYLFYKLL